MGAPPAAGPEGTANKAPFGRGLAWLAVVCVVVVAAGMLLWRAPLKAAANGTSGLTAPMASANATGSAAPTESATAATAGESRGPGSTVSNPAGGLTRVDDLLAAAQSSASSTDARLLRIYGLIATGQAQQALNEASRLASDLPNFGLAQLVYADLLTTQTQPTEEFAAPRAKLRAEAADRLRELVAEARARVAAAGRRPPPGAVPSQFVRLDPSVRHAVAVDISTSRLYVFENTPTGLVLKRDYYSSVGKLGMAKQVEGDLRTPLGVYFVTGRISDARLRDPALDDRYGAAALALNYPNQYDQLKGRTGSGIWLHGVASSLFSRAPLATDGCVALSNPDLLDVTQFIERQETPILIAERIEWVAPGAAVERHAGFLKTFEAWKAARRSADTDAQQRFYAADGKLANGNEAARADRRRTAVSAGDVEGVSVLSWRDDRDVVVVTFTESQPNAGRPRLKRQYWLEQAGAWQVIYEGSLG